jgi:hypothetical protein
MKRKTGTMRLTKETLHGLDDQLTEKAAGGVSVITCFDSCTCQTTSPGRTCV